MATSKMIDSKRYQFVGLLFLLLFTTPTIANGQEGVEEMTPEEARIALEQLGIVPQPSVDIELARRLHSAEAAALARSVAIEATNIAERHTTPQTAPPSPQPTAYLRSQEEFGLHDAVAVGGGAAVGLVAGAVVGVLGGFLVVWLVDDDDELSGTDFIPVAIGTSVGAVAGIGYGASLAGEWMGFSDEPFWAPVGGAVLGMFAGSAALNLFPDPPEGAALAIYGGVAIGAATGFYLSLDTAAEMKTKGINVRPTLAPTVLGRDQKGNLVPGALLLQGTF